MGVTSKIIHRPVIAPHFSICLDKLIEGVTAKNVHRIMGSLDTDISGLKMNMTVDYRKNYVQIADLKNSKQLEKIFNATWKNVWSKTCIKGWDTNDCIPCLTFHLPRVFLPDEYLVLTVHDEGSDFNNVMIEVYEPYQKSVTMNKADWTKTLYLSTKASRKRYYNVEEEVMEYYDSSSNCDPTNEQKIEDFSKSLITKALGCRLPWIKFNGDWRECDQEQDFDNYFELIHSEDFIAKNEVKPNCRRSVLHLADTGDERFHPEALKEEVNFQFLKSQVSYSKLKNE